MALAQNLASIGIEPRSADFLGDTIADGLTALGNASQANALALTSSINSFTTVTAVANSGRLPAIAMHPQSCVVVRNDDAADSLNIFPATGESINGLGPNASIAIAPGSSRVFFKVSATKWVTT